MINRENVYSIAEAICFLQTEYGSENMPSSEETLRRAVRSGQLRVQESRDPGRKGYTIRESDLRQYAQRRLDRIQRRKDLKDPEERSDSFLKAKSKSKTEKIEPEYSDAPIPFPDLCGQHLAGDLSSEMYYLGLFREKMKWENRIAKKREQLKQLEVQSQIILSDIAHCQSEIEAYLDGISKYK